MTPEHERFLALLETKRELGEKKWVQDVKTKWKPPEGIFTKSAKEIAETIAAASDDYATAVRRVVFYYNRAGVCNKGGDNFNEAECKKACRVLRLVAKAFGVKDKDANLKYCEVVSEGLDTAKQDDLSQALAQFLEAFPEKDYSAEVVYSEKDSAFLPDYYEYVDALAELVGEPGNTGENTTQLFDDERGYLIVVSTNQQGVEIKFSVINDPENSYVILPPDFSFPTTLDSFGVTVRNLVSHVEAFDALVGRSYDAKKTIVSSILDSLVVITIPVED